MLTNGSNIVLANDRGPSGCGNFGVIVTNSALTGRRVRTLRRHLGAGGLDDNGNDVAGIRVLSHCGARVIRSVGLTHHLGIIISYNGNTTNIVTPRLVRTLGYRIVPLFYRISNGFPGRRPSPNGPRGLISLVTGIGRAGTSLNLTFSNSNSHINIIAGANDVICPSHLLVLFTHSMLTHGTSTRVVFSIGYAHHLAPLVGRCNNHPLV